MLAAALLFGCADRVAPVDASVGESIPRCVQPDPLPRVRYCDDLGEINLCREWGMRYAAGAHSFMQCNPPLNVFTPDAFVPASCVSAYSCDRVEGGGGSRWNCTCGNEPGCGDGFVCVRESPDATPNCRCTMQ